MTQPTLESARRFVNAVELPLRTARGESVEDVGDDVTAALDAGKNQATVVGSDVISFVRGVTEERREAIINSSLLAQLVADRKVTDRSDIDSWYNEYFDVLSNVGWVVQERGFAEYNESSANFESHKAILALATTLLGAAPTALALVKTTIDALHSMDESRPWITIFNRESERAEAARFQIGLAEEAENGQFYVTVMAFALKANSQITQVLFFKAKKNDVRLRHLSGRVTINTTVLDGVRDAVRAKLAGRAGDYVRTLPDL